MLAALAQAGQPGLNSPGKACMAGGPFGFRRASIRVMRAVFCSVGQATARKRMGNHLK